MQTRGEENRAELSRAAAHTVIEVISQNVYNSHIQSWQEERSARHFKDFLSLISHVFEGAGSKKHHAAGFSSPDLFFLTRPARLVNAKAGLDSFLLLMC